jgi:hypothetical protein
MTPVSRTALVARRIESRYPGNCERLAYCSEGLMMTCSRARRFNPRALSLLMLPVAALGFVASALDVTIAVDQVAPRPIATPGRSGASLNSPWADEGDLT